MEKNKVNQRNAVEAGIRSLYWLWLILALMMFFYHIQGIGPFIVDDSYITFRYARNLSHGYGLVYNPGGSHTEGFTSPLWMVTMSVPFLLHLSPELFSRYLGIFFTLLTLGLSFLVMRRLLPENIRDKYHWITGGMVFAFAAWPATAVHAIAGMETALYTFLVTFYFYRLMIYLENPCGKKALFLAISGFMVGLTRPEGNLIPLISMGTALFLLSKKDKLDLIKRAMVGYVLPGILYFVARYAYFGLMFPLPYYVKLGNQVLFAGWLFMFLYLSDFFLAGGFMIIFSVNKLTRQLLPLWVTVFGFLLFFFFPVHVMGYEGRFIYPVMPMLFCLIFLGCLSLGEGLIAQVKWMQKKAVAWRVSMAVVFIPIALVMMTYPKIQQNKIEEYQGMLNAHLQLGKDLSMYPCNPRQMHLAMGDAGAVPYFSDWNTTDIIGLNSKEMALNRNLDAKAEAILKSNPDLIVLVSNSYKEFTSPVLIDNYLYRHISWVQSYKLARIYQFQADYHYLWVMAKPDSPLFHYFYDSPGEKPFFK
jgi:hypothetical protein